MTVYILVYVLKFSAAQLVAHKLTVLFSQIIKKYQIFFLIVLNTSLLNMNYILH